MKIIANIIALLGNIIALLISGLSLLNNFRYFNLDTLGYTIATLIGLVGTLVAIWMVNKKDKFMLIFSGIILVLCGIAYLFLILSPWPFRLGYFEYMYLSSIIIVFFAVPLMFIGAILFFFTARKMTLKT
jgi:hypothetical protein